MPNPDEMKRIAEQRAHPRVPTAISAKIAVPADSMVQECLVTDLSIGGAGLQFVDVAPRAEMVCLLAINGFGSFEGITTRAGGAVLGVRFLVGEAERRRLQENLITFIIKGMSAVGELCKQEYHAERPQLALTRTSGEHHLCNVQNISLQGIALQTSIRPPLGELVKLERVYGRVVRHDEDGIGIQFVNFVNPSEPAASPAIGPTV